MERETDVCPESCLMRSGIAVGLMKRQTSVRQTASVPLSPNCRKWLRQIGRQFGDGTLVWPRHMKPAKAKSFVGRRVLLLRRLSRTRCPSPKVRVIGVAAVPCKGGLPVESSRVNAIAQDRMKGANRSPRSRAAAYQPATEAFRSLLQAQHACRLPADVIANRLTRVAPLTTANGTHIAEGKNLEKPWSGGSDRNAPPPKIKIG